MAEPLWCTGESCGDWDTATQPLVSGKCWHRLLWARTNQGIVWPHQQNTSYIPLHPIHPLTYQHCHQDGKFMLLQSARLVFSDRQWKSVPSTSWRKMAHIACLGSSVFYLQCLIGCTQRMLSGETTTGKVRWWYIAGLIKGRSWSSWALLHPWVDGRDYQPRTIAKYYISPLIFFFFLNI